jgi:hypothetical protein
MMLLSEGEYQFMGFILSNENNQEFNNSLNKSYKDLHISTGKHCGVCVFDIPPKTWLEKNFKWLLEKYSICRNHEVVVVKDIYFHNKSY